VESGTQALLDGTADLERARAAFAAALRAGDTATAVAAYDRHATLVAPAGELLRGRQMIERFWRTGIEIGVDNVELDLLELELRGDIALEVGQYQLHVAAAPGTPAAVNRGRYLVVHRLGGDGRWRRAAEMFSPDHVVGSEG
jgi:ketosteroid isomerase-like protein